MSPESKRKRGERIRVEACRKMTEVDYYVSVCLCRKIDEIVSVNLIAIPF